jgi:hypothetical protein
MTPKMPDGLQAAFEIYTYHSHTQRAKTLPEATHTFQWPILTTSAIREHPKK